MTMPDGMVKTRSRLKAVAPKAAEPSKPKILVFGKPGVGKTWASLDFPSVFYIDTEGGADLAHYTDKLERAGGVYLGPDQGSLSFETILEQVQALATEKHAYRTLVIDSISKVFNVEIANEAERLGDRDAFGASKKPAVSYMRRLTSWLQRIDMNVIMIAHERAEWGLVNGQRAEIGATFDAWDRLAYELHLVLNITKSGPIRLARIGKSRLLGFPEGTTFPWSYSDFAERYGRDVIEKAAQQILVASPEQIAEVNRLLEIVKMPDDWQAKVFQKAGVDSWAEMDAEKVEKCIASLKERIVP
jgi:hypothetical protein